LKRLESDLDGGDSRRRGPILSAGDGRVKFFYSRNSADIELVSTQSLFDAAARQAIVMLPVLMDGGRKYLLDRAGHLVLVRSEATCAASKWTCRGH
jgi:hypothetical protein